MHIAIISDIHEDVRNLQKALTFIEKEKCQEIVCLGDIVGFSDLYYNYADSRNASECIRLVRENCKITIPGNHDYQAVKRLPKYNQGFAYPENWYALSLQEQSDLLGDKVWLYDDCELNVGLSNEDIEWLINLPEYELFDIDDYKVLFTHFVYPNLTGSLREFYTGNKAFDQHKQFMQSQNAILSFSGHQHFLGLLISSNRLKTKRFYKKYKVQEHDAIIIPPIASNKHASGFCIFDTNRFTVTAKTI